MSEYFETTVRFLRQADNGLVKKCTESYLVDAMSFTEAEARVMSDVGEGMREVTMMSSKRSQIKEVIFYGDTDLWFKAKVTYSLMDEESEKDRESESEVQFSNASAQEMTFTENPQFQTLNPRS
jgi:hypothetical protein